MYNFLSGKFATSIHREVLEPQLQKYALSLLIVRTDCDQLSSEPELEPDLFPFTDVQSGSRIAVCGAGTLGQHMIRRLSNKDEFRLVAWVDELHEEYKKLGLPVDSPEDLIEITFDHILVAFIDESIAAKVSDYLQQIGVQRGKICQVDFKLKNVTQILSRYGFAIK
jgi:FlaA1/EpsC-like NDP-sugar epimerase